jgi:hypothetical protein
VPVWWTQHPSDHPVLTGWLAGPGTNDLGRLDEIKLSKPASPRLPIIRAARCHGEQPDGRSNCEPVKPRK